MSTPPASIWRISAALAAVATSRSSASAIGGTATTEERKSDAFRCVRDMVGYSLDNGERSLPQMFRAQVGISEDVRVHEPLGHHAGDVAVDIAERTLDLALGDLDAG